jgi:hypothetical protein
MPWVMIANSMVRSQGFVDQLMSSFLAVVSQLKLLRGFHRLHAGTSRTVLMKQEWHPLGIVRTALQCAKAAYSQISSSNGCSASGMGSNNVSSSGSSSLLPVTVDPLKESGACL